MTRSVLRPLRRAAVTVLLVLPAMVSVLPGRASADVVFAPPGALILGPSVVAGTATDNNPPTTVDNRSLEQQQAEADGFAVTVVSASQWDAMTTADFANYRVLIIGDPSCGGLDTFAAAQSNQGVWEPAVMSSGGNRVLIGADPTYHSASGSAPNGFKVEADGIAYAGAVAGATGVYLDTSCAYSSGDPTHGGGQPPGTPVPIMDGLSTFGAHQFTAGGALCGSDVAIVAATGPTAGVTDADLSNWNCSVHAYFDTFPPDYLPVALATDPSVPPNYTTTDVDTGLRVTGSPYMLVGRNGITTRGGITVAPATGTDVAGGTHTVTATVTYTDAITSAVTPLSGVAVTFTVTSGPNTGASSSGVTASDGTLAFADVDAGGAGTDQIQATAQIPYPGVPGATTRQSATASEVWLPPGTAKDATTLRYTGPATGDFDDPFTASAVLTDASTVPPSPVANEPVVFTIGNASDAPTCTGTTDSTGTASCALTPVTPEGPAPIAVVFQGDIVHNPQYISTSLVAPFAVTTEEDTLKLFTPSNVINGRPATIFAQLLEDGTSGIGGRTVVITLGTGAFAQSCTVTSTDGGGFGGCTISKVAQPASATSVQVRGVFAGDGFFQLATATATVPLLYYTGRATSLSGTLLSAAIGPVTDTGNIQTSVASSVNAPSLASFGGIMIGGYASVTTGNERSSAVAGQARISIGLPAAPAIFLKAVQADSSSTCDGTSGKTTIAFLSVGSSVLINGLSNPAPNTVYNIGPVRIALNEQVPVPGARSKELTVIAVHITIPGVANLVFSSARSDIHNCAVKPS